jgi:hypothetical protein
MMPPTAIPAMIGVDNLEVDGLAPVLVLEAAVVVAVGTEPEVEEGGLLKHEVSDD